MLSTRSHLFEFPYAPRWGALTDHYCLLSVYALAAMVRSSAIFRSRGRNENRHKS